MQLRTRVLPFYGLLLVALIVALSVLSLFALASSARKTALVDGGIDLHPYWYYGHFVRYGINPYTAYVDRILLPEPAHYLFGSDIAPDKVVQPGLAMIPANTASTLLFSSLLSFIPWNPVKYIWFVFNLALILAIPWLTLRLLPPSLRLTNGLQWLIALSFYSLKGQRVALVNGQPSILVFFLMIVTLLLRQSHWVWAGLAFGVALGKYSLSFPVVIFLLLEKRFRVLAVAFLVQAVSLLAVSALDGGSLWETVQIYWNMVSFYSVGQPGVHLGYGFADYPGLTLVLLVFGTGMTLAALVYLYRRGLLATDLLPLNSLLCLWTLLVIYHRIYDTMVVLLFLTACLSAITAWQLPARQAQILGVFWVLALFVMCLPGEMLDRFLPADQAKLLIAWIDQSIIVMLLAMWGVNLWLLPRTPRVDA